jgi:circadian clock protein KaiB
MEEKNPGKEPNMNKYRLKLFISGSTIRSGLAITRVHSIFEKALGAEYELIVIDVLKQPQVAEEEKILVTPTLIKEFPPPVRRFLGDFSDKKQFLLGLDLLHHESRREEK